MALNAKLFAIADSAGALVIDAVDPWDGLLSSRVARLWLACSSKNVATSRGLAAGAVSRTKAARPATLGLAMEVPLSVLVALSPVCQADITS